MNRDVLIIGYGVVGSNLEKELKNIKPDIVDKKKKEVNTIRNIHYDIGFICVDTPLNDDKELDISEIINSINDYDCEIYCIKSTCPVGTLEKLLEQTGKKIVISPEYKGNTIHNNINFNFTILGGKKEDCEQVRQITLPCYDGSHVFKIVEPKMAELVKFMENSFLATKLSFCQSFYNICEEEGLSYNELRELFLLDPRVNSSHTLVYKEQPYWDSHCLNKDVAAIANQYDMELIKDVIEFNDKQKNR